MSRLDWFLGWTADRISRVGARVGSAGARRLAGWVFRFAYQLSPDDPYTLRFLAWSLREAGDLQGAIQHYEKLLEQTPDFVDGRVELGFAYADLERYSQAIEQFEQALNHSPQNAAALRGLAGMLLATNHAAEAIGVCEELLRGEPEDSVGWWFLARARANTYQWNHALAAYETAQSLDSDPRVAADHANVLIEMNRGAEAHAIVKTALAKYPNDRGLQVELACILIDLAQYGDAEVLLNEILQEEPESAPVRGLQVTLLVDTGRATEATTVAERLRADFPHDASAHATLGWVALKSARPHDALMGFDAALRLEPGRLDLTARRAMALKCLGRDSEALSLIATIIERDPSYFDHNPWCAELRTLRDLDDERGR